MTDQVQITEPTIEDIIFNMAKVPLPDLFEAAHLFPLNFKMGQENWELDVIYNAEDNFMLNFQRQADKSMNLKKSQLSIEFSNQNWHVWHKSTAINGNFLEVILALNELKDKNWAQHALMALEVPLEEIDEAA